MAAWGCSSGVTPNRSSVSEVRATPGSPGSGSTTRETRWGVKCSLGFRTAGDTFTSSRVGWTLSSLLPPCDDLKLPLRFSLSAQWCTDVSQPSQSSDGSFPPWERGPPWSHLHSQSCCLIILSLCSVYSPSLRALFSLSLSSLLFKEKLFKPGSRRGSPVSSISSLHEDRRSCFHPRQELYSYAVTALLYLSFKSFHLQGDFFNHYSWLMLSF